MEGSLFRDHMIKDLDNETQEYHKSLSLIDWFRLSDNLDRIYSICGEIDDNIKIDLNCTQCESFFKLEKIDLTRYQFHLFNRKKISYMRTSIYTTKNINLRYEIVCDQFNNVTDHYLQQPFKKKIKIKQENLDLNRLNNSLIYSTNDFLYCSFYLPIKEFFKLNEQELHFDLTERTQMELEFGIFSKDDKSRIRKSVRQFSLDFTTPNVGYSIQEYRYVLISSSIGLIIILFICISCCIIKKYKKLSQKLTQAGSRISNLNITSAIDSNASNLSDSRLESSNQSTNNQVSELISGLPTKVSEFSNASYIPKSRQSYTTSIRQSSISPSLNSSARSKKSSSSITQSSSFSNPISELKTKKPRSKSKKYRSKSKK